MNAILPTAIPTIPTSIQSAYWRWQNTHRAPALTLDQFASIYRLGVTDTLRRTAALSPQMESLAELVRFCSLSPES